MDTLTKFTPDQLKGLTADQISALLNKTKERLTDIAFLKYTIDNMTYDENGQITNNPNQCEKFVVTLASMQDEKFYLKAAFEGPNNQLRWILKTEEDMKKILGSVALETVCAHKIKKHLKDKYSHDHFLKKTLNTNFNLKNIKVVTQSFSNLYVIHPLLEYFSFYFAGAKPFQAPISN